MRLQGTCPPPPPPFRESISWIISPFKFWTATIFLHAHLQVVYYKCVKFHKNPVSWLGGGALTRYMDGRTDGRKDGRRGWFLYTPPNFVCGGYNKGLYWGDAWQLRQVDQGFLHQFSQVRPSLEYTCSVSYPTGSDFPRANNKTHQSLMTCFII